MCYCMLCQVECSQVPVTAICLIWLKLISALNMCHNFLLLFFWRFRSVCTGLSLCCCAVTPNSRGKHSCHSSGFLHGIFLLTFWLAEAAGWLAAGSSLLDDDTVCVPLPVDNRILCVCHRVLYKQLCAWMVHGLAHDPHHEFFIQRVAVLYWMMILFVFHCMLMTGSFMSATGCCTNNYVHGWSMASHMTPTMNSSSSELQEGATWKPKPVRRHRKMRES